MNLNALAFNGDRKGQEVKTLVALIILVVFLLLMIGAIILMWQEGNIFSGEGNICESTGWLFGGCT